MATREEVYAALDIFYKNRPQKAFEEISKQRMGYVAVLVFLSKADKEVNSIDISKALEISSARTAVLLKKLELKKTIVKKHSKTDARAIIIELTDKGREAVESVEEKMFASAQKLVDEMGIDEIRRVFEGLNKINSILHENRPNKMEDDND